MGKILVAAIILIVIILGILGYFVFLNPTEEVINEQPIIQKNDFKEDIEVDSETEEKFCMEYREISGSTITGKVEYGTCSNNKPAYCDDGALINNCKLCWCEESEVCSDNGECIIKSGDASGGGAETGGEGREGSSGGGGGGASQQSGGCSDSDISNSPSPIYLSGSCSDNTSTYFDDCKDPSTGLSSTIWIKEYKCQNIGGQNLCVGEYKECPLQTLNFYGNNNSICSLQKCSVPPSCSDEIQNQNETGVDCGGVCPACEPTETCFDEIQNQNETGVDCGGVCPSCGGGGEGEGEGGGPDCYISPIDPVGLSIFTNSVCYDLQGSYSNSCSDPVGGSSNIFIKTNVCISDKCTPKYYSCPPMGEKHFSQNDYSCFQGLCQP